MRDCSSSVTISPTPSAEVATVALRSFDIGLTTVELHGGGVPGNATPHGYLVRRQRERPFPSFERHTSGSGKSVQMSAKIE